MLAKRIAGVFPTKHPAPLQFWDYKINELIKGGGEVRGQQHEAVASAIDKPFLHNIGHRSCVPACKQVTSGHGDLVVDIPQCETSFASLLIGDLRIRLNRV